MGKPCSEDDCDKPRWARGYCLQHDKLNNKSKYEIKSKGVSTTNATPKLVKRSFIKPISDKKAIELKEYRIVRDAYLKANPVCLYPNCANRDVQLHHAKGRVGSLLGDVKYFRSLCDTHHKFCELNPDKAKELGLSINRLDK
jgi:hypothetical protein